MIYVTNLRYLLFLRLIMGSVRISICTITCYHPTAAVRRGAVSPQPSSAQNTFALIAITPATASRNRPPRTNTTTSLVFIALCCLPLRHQATLHPTLDILRTCDEAALRRSVVPSFRRRVVGRPTSQWPLRRCAAIAGVVGRRLSSW